MELIRAIDEHTVECLLTCGHWSTGFSNRSSHFDFPDEAHDCPICGTERQWDVRLQAACYAEIFGT